MRVLVACEYSGTVREAFRKRGHDAWSCDLLDTDIEGQHMIGDVMGVLGEKWDLMIAHPPCTYLTNAGVCWLKKDKKRFGEMQKGAQIFYELLNSDIPKICVENPIMHKYAVNIIGRRQDQVIQPWMFGHKEKKATCLWLKNLPKLVPTTNLKAETEALPKHVQQRIHYASPGPDRWKIRSKTFQGIADAIAEQWGGLENVRAA